MKARFQPACMLGTVTKRITIVALLATLGSSHAATFKDARFEALQDGGKYTELEQLAQARLKADPANPEASAALSLALTLVDTTDPKRLDAGARQALQCIDQHPMVAVCHLAAAENLGMQMVNMGMASAMRNARNLKQSWLRALELDPASFTARVQLAKLYLALPGMMGGSNAKAKELELAVRSSQPETARIIRVYLAAEDKKWAEMETDLLAIRASKDGAMRKEVREATLQLAKIYLNGGKDLAKAASLYERLQRDQPESAAGFYGMSRVYAAKGQTDGALHQLEQARSLGDAADYPIEHRLGDAYLAKGDKVAAKAAYLRYLGNKRTHPANLETVRQNLSQIN